MTLSFKGITIAAIGLLLVLIFLVLLIVNIVQHSIAKSNADFNRSKPKKSPRFIITIFSFLLSIAILWILSCMPSVVSFLDHLKSLVTLLMITFLLYFVSYILISLLFRKN